MATFRMRYYDAPRTDLTPDLSPRNSCYRDADGKHVASYPAKDAKKARTDLANRLKADGFRLMETTEDGWTVYVSTIPPRKAVTRQLSGFAAFCKRRIIHDAKPLSFVEVLSRSHITLHPANCWCPKHNAPRKAAQRKAA